MRQRNGSRASNLPSSTTERPATRKGARARDPVRPTRTISPAFRSGPRQKRHDPNADEIIRFVREFQRGDLQHQGPAGLARKSVLPAIGGHNSSDSFSTSYNMNESTDVTNAEPSSTARGANTHSLSTVADSENPNRSPELPENEDFLRHFKRAQVHIGVDVLTNEQLTRHNNDDLFHFNSNDMEQGQETATSSNCNLMPTDQGLANSGWQQSLKHDDSLLNGSTSHYISKPVQTTPRFLNGVSKAAQLLRPRALPQLPPLMRGGAPTRPSAPSPSLTPPSPRSMDSGDEGSFEEDLDVDDRMNIENRNLDYDETI